MESEPTGGSAKRQKNGKRRDKLSKSPQNMGDRINEDSGDDSETPSTSRSFKDKGKGKSSRRRRDSSPDNVDRSGASSSRPTSSDESDFEESIIDGFAIIGFTSFDQLENYCNQKKSCIKRSRSKCSTDSNRKSAPSISSSKSRTPSSASKPSSSREGSPTPVMSPSPPSPTPSCSSTSSSTLGIKIENKNKDLSKDTKTSIVNKKYKNNVLVKVEEEHKKCSSELIIPSTTPTTECSPAHSIPGNVSCDLSIKQEITENHVTPTAASVYKFSTDDTKVISSQCKSSPPNSPHPLSSPVYTSLSPKDSIKCDKDRLHIKDKEDYNCNKKASNPGLNSALLTPKREPSIEPIPPPIGAAPTAKHVPSIGPIAPSLGGHIPPSIGPILTELGLKSASLDNYPPAPPALLKSQPSTVSYTVNAISSTYKDSVPGKQSSDIIPSKRPHGGDSQTPSNKYPALPGGSLLPPSSKLSSSNPLGLPLLSSSPTPGKLSVPPPNTTASTPLLPISPICMVSTVTTTTTTFSTSSRTVTPSYQITKSTTPLSSSQTIKPHHHSPHLHRSLSNPHSNSPYHSNAQSSHSNAAHHHHSSSRPRSRSSLTPGVTPPKHPSIIRELPKPIPGLSGTRIDEQGHSKGPSPAFNWQRSNSNPGSLHRSTPGHSPASSHSSLHPHTPTSSLHVTPLPPHHLPSHGLFAPPLAPHVTPPSSLTSSSLPFPGSIPPSPYGMEPLSSLNHSAELMRAQQELSARFIQDRERGTLPGSLGPSPLNPQVPYLRTETHNHQHNHLHQHNHNHTHQHITPGYLPPHPLGTNGIVPPTSLHLKTPPGASSLLGSSSLAELDRAKQLEKMKYDAALYARGVPGLPGYPGLPQMPPHLPGLSTNPAGPGPLVSGPGPLGSGPLGAFQPKVRGVTPSQLLMSIHDRGKAAAPPSSSQPPIKKSGKWCAAHVKIAWEIHMQQQKQKADGSNSLRPMQDAAKPTPEHPSSASSHLLGAAGLPRPDTSALLSAHARSPFDGALPSHHQAAAAAGLLGSNPLGLPPFPRPSPYATGLSTLGSSAFGGLGTRMIAPGSGLSRDMQSVPGLASPHEWSRLHRTPPSFPQPPTSTWSKSEADINKEREREIEIARAKEKEREREIRDIRERENRSRDDVRRSPSRERHNHVDGPRMYNSDPRADTDRARSRSPLRNGPISAPRPGSVTHSNPSPDSRLKDADREREELLAKKRKLEAAAIAASVGGPRPDLVGIRPPNSALPSSLLPPNAMLDRSRMFAPYSSLGLERGLPPHTFLNPMDIERHRLEIQQVMEREMLNRLSNPLGSLAEEKYREEIMRQEREALAHMDRARLSELERSKLLPPPLRPSDPPYFGFPPNSMYGAHRGASPLLLSHNSSSKSNSPSTIGPGPPPLISTASAGGRSHSGSPATKPRHDSPMTDNKPTSNGLDTDSTSHSR